MTMLLTPDKIYFATSAAKGIPSGMWLITAKHLETLVSKDGVALEILKRTKDEEVNRKTFTDIMDAMKNAGVNITLANADHRKRWGFSQKTSSRESL